MPDIKLFTSVSEAVKSIFGESRYVVKKNYVAGGDINETCTITLDDGTILFMKTNIPAFLTNFKAEAAGLEAIRATGAIGVPAVLGAGTDTGFSFLFLTYIRGGGRISHYWETFAEELAAVHRADLPEFGKSDEMVCRTVDIVRKTRFAIAERHLRHLPHQTYPAADGKQGPYGHP